MIKYALEDNLTNQFELSGAAIAEPANRSLTPGDDSFLYENKIVPNSFLDGSVKLGLTRIESRELLLTFSRALGEDVSAFRAAENELLEFLLRTKYLIDLTNSLKVEVTIKNYNIGYGSGAHKMYSDNEITFELLKPNWETTSVSTINESLSATDVNQINIDNNGFLKVYPVITFTTANPLDLIKMYIEESKEGIIIGDDLFGTDPDYMVLEIDCKEGTIDMGDLDRTISIYPGTGYFPFPVGEFVLRIIPSIVCDVEISFYKGYYI